MEDKFLEYLNSFGHPVGTWISIILGGIALITGIIISIKKIKKKYDDRLKYQIKKEEETKEFMETVIRIEKQVTELTTNVTNLTSQHENSIVELNNKIEDIRHAVTESQQDSKDGDLALEQQIKNFENTIDDIKDKISSMDEKTSLLITSDRDGIKSYIIDKYYQVTKDGYINPHSLQVLESRYVEYLQENGNTYIEGMMKAIRKLPNEKPKESKRKSKSRD